MIVCMGGGGTSLCASLCIGLWVDMLGQCSLMMLTCVRVTFAFLFQVSCSYFYCKYILHHKYTHIQLYPLGPYFQFLNVFYSVWIIGQRATQGGLPKCLQLTRTPCMTGRYTFPRATHLPSSLFQNWSPSSCLSTEPDIKVYLRRIQSCSHHNRKT